MAYGALPDLEPVGILVGPGNKYVVEAKLQLFDQVGIDCASVWSESCARCAC
jgi:histidinol dehydrogenase